MPRVSMLVGRHGWMSMLSRAEACTRLRERKHAWSGAIVTCAMSDEMHTYMCGMSHEPVAVRSAVVSMMPHT